MQHATGQYDHLARVPRTAPRQSRGRRSIASRHWCGAAPRRSRGMEPTVRSARTQSAIIITGRLETPLFALARPLDPEPLTVICRSKIRPPGTEFLDAETGGQESTRETVIV